MSTETFRITVSNLPVNVVRKSIKNLHVGVYPPDGRVRVAAPLAMTDEAVRLAVVNRLAWIARQQAKFEGQRRQSEREMVGGECHYFKGRRYRLRIVHHEGKGTVVVRSNSILEVQVRQGAGHEHMDRVLQQWYRQELKVLVPPLLDKWQPILGVTVTDWRIKRMKTKWGTCNAQARRIWLNLELAKKPVQCLEYVVVHELTHLIEPHHSPQFLAILDEHMPQWKMHRNELGALPLAHENWGDN